MSIIENSLEKVAALCVGATAMTFGVAPGVVEASVGAAGLIGFVLGRRQKFGPENHRVRQRIQAELLESYSALVSGSDGGAGAQQDLIAANAALDAALEKCVIDRQKLAASAVTSKGFPDRAVEIVMEGLGEAYPEFFSDACASTLPYRFATDVVRAGITAAVRNADYYRQLEPQLMFEMARVLGEVREDIVAIKLTVEQIRDEYRRELDVAKQDFHATETDLIGLLAVILQKRVSRENLLGALEQAYERLTQLRESMGDLRSLGNEIPEIASLLEKVDVALSGGEGFSLNEAEEALELADQRYAELIAERESEVRRDKENRARILGKRADLAAIQIDFKRAVNLYRAELKLNIELWGSDHPDTVITYKALSSALAAQGQHAESEAFYRKVLKIQERVLGPDHPDTADSYVNLASSFKAQGRNAEAEALYQKALEILERVFGPNHLDTAMTYYLLAGSLDAQGRVEELEALYRKIIEIPKKVFGPDHLGTARSYIILSLTLRAKGWAAEAVAIHRKAIEIYEQVLGPGHPDLLERYNRFAQDLESNDLATEAADIYRKALEIEERAHGDDNLSVAQGYNKRAYYFYIQGLAVEAEPFYRKALEIRERILGPYHLDTAKTYNNLASCLCKQGRAAEAEPLLRKALAIVELLGPDHPDTATMQKNIKIFIEHYYEMKSC